MGFTFQLHWEQAPWFVSPNTPARGQLFINSFILYAYDTADDKDDDNYATVLDSYVTTISLWVAKVHTKKVPGLDHFVLAKKWGISPKKALNMIGQTTQHWIHTVLHPSLSWQFRKNDCQLQYRTLPQNVYSDTLFATTVSRRGNRCAQIFTLFMLTIFRAKWVPWWRFHHEFNLEDILVLILFSSRFSYFKVTSDSVQYQRNNYWVGGIKWVFYLYGTCGLTGNKCQKLRDFISQHIIHATLHWAEKMVIEALHFNCLVDWKDNNLTFSGMV